MSKRAKLDDLKGIDRLMRETQQGSSLSEIFDGVLSLADKEEKVRKVGEMVMRGVNLVMPRENLEEDRKGWLVLVGLAFLGGLGIGYLLAKGNVKV